MPFNVTELLACSFDQTYITYNFILFCITFLPCVIGNSVILISIFKFNFLRTGIHILIGNLAVADLLVGVALLFVPFEFFLSREIFSGKYLCLAKYSLLIISLSSSIANLLAMSLERLASIAFPLQHRAYFRKSKLYVGIWIIWIIHIIFGLLPVLGWNNYSPENNIAYEYCVNDLVWPHEYCILLTVDLTFGLVINAIIYTAIIYIAIREGRKQIQREQFRSQSTVSSSIKKKTKMVMIVFGAFAICWLPFVIMSIVILFKDTAQYRCIQHWLIGLGFVNSSINWAIYGLTNAKFKQAFCKLFKSSC